MIKSISAKDFASLVASERHIDLIDVRTPVEFRSMHISVARNVPLNQLDPMSLKSTRTGSSHEPLYVVCRSGGRSRQACEKLIAAGVNNVINVEGGTIACEVAGAPLNRGKKAIPLNCQVQIITGVTVVAGGVMTLLTNNPYWLSLPIGMGAGLVFSGLTNTCAIGTFLSQMPWNQVNSGSAPAANSPRSQANDDAASRCCN